MKWYTATALTVGLFAGSCKPFKILLPSPLDDNAIRIHVRHSSASIFRHRIRLDGFEDATIYASFDLTETGHTTLLPFYFDLNPLVLFVDNHFNKVSTEEKKKFMFDLPEGADHYRVFCSELAVSSGVYLRRANLSVNTMEFYQYEALIIRNADTAHAWRLRFHGSTDAKGLSQASFADVQHTPALLENDQKKIDVVVPRDTKILYKGNKAALPPGALVTYQFVSNGAVVAAVDLLKNDIWVLPTLEKDCKMAIITASVCLLNKEH